MCELAALYHDLGRFPQYSRYKTMSDAISVNHALLSFKTLRKTKRLKGLSPKNRRLVLRAVFMHNRPELPQGLPPDLDYLARVLRDADKLDIMPVVIGMLKKAENNHGIPYLNLPSDPQKYSPHVIELLRQRKRPHISQAHWSNDYVLFICGWIYDMNFQATWRLVAKRGFLGVLFSMLPQTPDLLSLGEQITGDLALLAQGEKTPWET
ncbi:HD family phosphohydrolase [Dethiosulfatarculus sandiegensis]|uniref:HD family phosphohydrolase n=1 Tax=Dethiosulfatarculus sandiegensis TaxID=1429043 RepID=A0A0D2G843_9BACT|nr:HD family phosphohydrolase [Dethiosulfatarculus sandiegensis]